MEVVKYDVTDAAIEELGKRYLGLTIKDIDNKEEFEAVHEARMVVKGKRVEVEKARKEYKAEALEYGRKVDTEAKRVFALLEPIETHLQTEEDKVINEKKRIQEEAERIEKVKIQGRVDELGKYNLMLPYMDVAVMDDTEFEIRLSDAKNVSEAEEARKAEEEKERIAKHVELDRKRAEQDKRDGELQEKEDALKAQSEAFEKEKRDIEKKRRKEKERKDLEKLAEETKKKALQDAQDEIERKAKEAKAKEEAEKAEAERRAALMPDKEKLFAWAEAVEKAVPVVLDLNSKEAKGIFIDAVEVIEDIVEQVKKKARDM